MTTKFPPIFVLPFNDKSPFKNVFLFTYKFELNDTSFVDVSVPVNVGDTFVAYVDVAVAVVKYVDAPDAVVKYVDAALAIVK